MKKIRSLIVLGSLFLLSVSGCTDDTEVKSIGPTAQTDMENLNCWMNPQTVVKCDAHTGQYACRLNKDMEWGFGYLDSYANFNTIPKRIEVSFWAKVSHSAEKVNLVVSIDTAGTHKFWIGRPLQKYFGKPDNWEHITETVDLPVTGIYPSETLAAYIWNPGKTDIIYDDFKVTLSY
jgi:hypothetical protein